MVYIIYRICCSASTNVHIVCLQWQTSVQLLTLLNLSVHWLYYCYEDTCKSRSTETLMTGLWFTQPHQIQEWVSRDYFVADIFVKCAFCFFQILCATVSPAMTCRVHSMTVEKKMLALLWLLGNQESYRSVADRFGISKGKIICNSHRSRMFIPSISLSFVIVVTKTYTKLKLKQSFL